MKKLLTLLLVISLSILPLTGCFHGTKIFEFKPTKVITDGLYVSTDNNGKAVGGSSHLTVEIKKNRDKKIRVGFFEEEVAGTGDMWKAAGWSAALTATLLTGVNLADYEISYTIEGRADGPSAGGLMTVATLASLMGEKIKKDATMTGTINIDGSIGPVGGIAHKLDGAKKAKKKLVLVPTGERFSVDKNTNESVDVVDKGEDLGITVKTVDNVYEAYEELVGKPLPKPKAPSDDDPELPESSISKVKAKAKEWYSRYQEKRTLYNSISAVIRKDFNSLVIETDALVQSSSDHYNQGLFATSYGEILQATALLEMVYASAKSGDAALGAILRGQSASLRAANREATSLSAASSRIDSLFERLKEEKPKNLSESLAIANSYGALLEGSGLEKIADSYANVTGTFSQRLQAIMMSAFFYAAPPLYVEYAEDFLELGLESKGAPAPSKQKIKAMAEILRKAAESNINVFETTILSQQAEASNVSVENYKQAFMNREIYYAFAKGLMDMASVIKDKAGKGISGDYATLGAAMNSYTYSSYLMAKYYSLRGTVDANGNITSVANEKALIDMLEYNLDHTKENIAIAKKAGGDSPFPVISYEKAKVGREQSVDKKVESLLDFWKASLESQIMTMLSGRLELTPSESNDGKTLEYKWAEADK